MASVDIAKLGMDIDSRDAKKAADALGGLERQAAKTETKVQKTTKATDSLGATAKKATAILASMAAVVGSLSVALGSAEAYTSMTNGLKALGQSGEEASATLQGIADIANRTRAPLESTAALYTRLSIGAQSLGASQQELLGFTEAVGLALGASGTSAAQASGALLQLSQAMAGGVVRAEEFNSIIEGAPGLLFAAARGIEGVEGDIGKLRKMMIDGELTSRMFFDALMSQSGALEEAFANTVPTVGQAFTVLNNNVTMFIGELNSATGVTENMAKVILMLAENVDRIAAYAGTAAVAFGTYYVGAIVLATAKTLTFAGALTVLRRALIATGVGALIVGAGELVLWFTRLVDATGGWGGALSALGDLASGVWQGIQESAKAIPIGLKAVWATVAAGFYTMVGNLQRSWLKFIVSMSRGLAEIGADGPSSMMAQFAENIGQGLDDSIEKADEFSAKARQLTEDARGMASEGFATAREAASKLATIISEAGDVTTDTSESTGKMNDALNDTKDAAGGAGKAAGEAAEDLKKMADEIERLEDAADPTRKFRREMEKLDVLLENGLSDGAYANAVADLNEELVNSTPILSDVNDAFGQMVDYMFDGFKDGMSGIWDIFVSTLKSMAAAALKNRITISLGLGVAGGAGSAAMAGQGGGLLSNVLGLAGGGGSFLGGVASGLGGVLSGGGLASSFANLGGMLSGSVGITGGAIGAALPAVGIVAAPFLLAAAFKKTEVVVAEGVRARIEGAMLELDSYEKTKTNNGLGFSSGFDREFTRLDEAVQSAVGARLDATTAALGSLGFGTDLTGFSFSKRTEIKDGETFEGESEEVIREALNAAIEYLTDGALEIYQQAGEDVSTTLDRMVTSFNGVNEALYLLDQSLLPISLNGAGAAASLIDISGGLDSFNEKVGFVFSNMLTEQEQQARLTTIATDQLNATFDDLGQAIPDTRAEFMALLDAQDLTTESGRRAYSALLDVAQAFVTVRGAAQQAASSFDYSGEMSMVSSVFTARSRAADSALAQAEEALRAAFQAEEARVRDAYADQIAAAQAQADAARASAQSSAAAAQERAQLRESIASALERAYRDRRVLDAMGEMNRINAGTAFLRAAVAMGGTDDLVGLQAALDAVANPSTALFESFADYQHDFNVNTNLIAELKDITDGQLSVEMRTLRGIEDNISAVERAGSLQVAALEQSRDSTLSAMSAQMNALLGIDTSVLSVEEAIRNLNLARDAAEAASNATTPRDSDTEFTPGSIAAQINQIFLDELGRAGAQAGIEYYLGDYRAGQSLEDIRRSINNSAEGIRFDETGIPQYASGGMHGGGWRIVGERGPELEYTGPSRIHSSTETRRMLDNREVVEELKQLNNRIAYLQKENHRMARVLSKWDINGQPGTADGQTVTTEAAA